MSYTQNLSEVQNQVDAGMHDFVRSLAQRTFEPPTIESFPIDGLSASSVGPQNFGKKVINPIAAISAMSMLLEQTGQPAAGARVHTNRVRRLWGDQGLPALKYAGFGKAVNITLGLPFVRTSVDHGTAFDLAGSGEADPGSLIAAVEMAARLTEPR